MRWTKLSNARSGTLICYGMCSGRSKASGVALRKEIDFRDGPLLSYSADRGVKGCVVFHFDCLPKLS